MIPRFVIAGSARTHATSRGASASSNASTSLNSVAPLGAPGASGGAMFPRRAPQRERSLHVREREATANLLPNPDVTFRGEHHRDPASKLTRRDAHNGR